MNWKNKSWKFCFLLLFAIVFLQNFRVAIYANTGAIDLEREGNLTISFQAKEINFMGTNFQIYHIANMTKTTNFQLTEDFRNIGVSLEKLTATQWKHLAQDLTAYITKTKSRIVPMAEEVIDAKGKVTFTDLPVGLYLVIGECYNSKDEIYTPIPFLVSLPNKSNEDVWNYEVEAVVKYTLDRIGEPEKTPVTGDAEMVGSLLLVAGSMCGLISMLKKKC